MKPSVKRDGARWRSGRSTPLLAALLALPTSAFAASPAAATTPPVVSRLESPLVRIGAAPVVPPSARSTGALDPSRTVDLGLSLQPRDPAALAAYATAVSTPGSADYHRYVTPSSFASRFGPSLTSVTAVERAMRKTGLAVGALSANRLLLHVSGSVAHVESAFHAQLTGYRLERGRSGWATDGAPKLARAIAGTVQGVLGLDNLTVPQSQLRRAPLRRVPLRRALGVPAAAADRTAHVAVTPSGAPRACPTAVKDALSGGGWTDSQIAGAYGLSGLYARGDLGQGQTIALFELEPFSRVDVARFDRCYFGRSHLAQVTTVPVDGFNLVGPGSGESILDIDDLSALVPAAKILVYEAPNTTFGGIDEYNTIVSQDRANIVSTSWGECESALQTAAPGTQQLENYIFEEAAAQGQTVISAAGDTGSDDCAGTQFATNKSVAPYLSVDDPASQPFVLGVGGTSLLSDANPPVQTVWNHGTQWGGGGGGLSSTWPIPTWQASSGVPGVATSGYREVPDVSASADEWRGITVYSSPSGASGGPGSGPGGWTVVGGTSSAAPTWAAVLAEIAASGGSCATLPVTVGGADLGFVPPQLYAVAGNAALYAQSFSDITKGNNDVFGLGLGYPAGTGYDLASGLGTPIVTDAAGSAGLDASLCAVASGASTSGGRPSITGISPASGPTAGGGTVTITGSGFPSSDTGTVHVSFGTATASVTSVTSSSVTVDVPPSDLAAAASPTLAAGRVDVVVTISSGSGSVSSLPSTASSYEYVEQSTSAATVPTVSGTGPSGGNVTGGNVVTVYGSGFGVDGTPVVSFGGVAASGVDVRSSTELTAVVPPDTGATSCSTGSGFDPSAACQVEVVVSDSAGSSSTAPILPALSGPVVFTPQGIIAPTPETEVAPAATEYDYAPTPTITSITPDPAGESGSTLVTITGSGFNLDTFEWVNFGPASSGASEQTKIASISPTQITIDTPTGSAGGPAGRSALAGGVSVQSAGGLSDVYGLAYAGVPTVRAVGTLGGPSTGGSRITVRGTGLADVTSVQFASEVAPATYGASRSSVVTHAGPDRLVVVTPAGLPGPVDVEPCTASGCAHADPRADTFVYFTPGRPSISVVSPRAGPASGGTRVVVFGDNLDGAVGVRFGSHSTDRLASLSGYPDGDPYVLAAESAPGVAGTTVPVTVVTRAGSARLQGSGTFRYRPSAPAPPRDVRLHLGVANNVKMSWVAPASDGGSPVTSYTLQATAPGEPPTGGVFPATTRSARIAHIVADRNYTFRIRASNATHGAGAWTTLGPFAVGYFGTGYRIAASAGSVTGLGSLPGLGGVAGSVAPSSIVAIAATPGGAGYWLAASNGSVYAFGDAPPYSYAHPSSPVVAFAATPTGSGYFEVTATGVVYAFGGAHGFGPPDAGKRLPSPVVGIASTSDGRGYYVATRSGAVYGLGDAKLAGSGSSSPVVAITASPTGRGYWLLSATGKVEAFGGAARLGSPPASAIDGRAVGLAATSDGRGYWIVTSTGAVYSFGDAHYEGRATPLPGGYVGIAAG